MSNQPHPSKGQMDGSLGSKVYDDLRSTFLHDYLRDIKGLYYFYLNDERRAKLANMNRLQRAFLLLGWILKSLLLNLSPPRRIILVIALIFIFPLGVTEMRLFENLISIDFRPWGSLLILLVLMLELKDKLLAKDEINTARQVQLALLPRSHPDLPGWSVWSYSRPANDVGGDLVDYIELDGFRHGLLLGDVAGKGLGAALLTAKLQATMRALVPNAVSLDDLGSQMNKILFRDGLDNRYATLFYTELEHNSGTARYLNAGHNPALILRENSIDTLRIIIIPVGMMENAYYEEGVFEMHSGEMLFVYTDGLSEARSDKGEEFGEERVRTLATQIKDLTPTEAGKRVLREVDRFLGEAHPDDDLSMIIVVKH